MTTRQNGFTLLEVAIVLVIVALIAGGIVVGRGFIRNAEIRAALDESQFYIQSLGNFQTKYGAMPGDFTGAIEIWGAADAVPANCVTTVSDLLLTCDGDGDSWITDQTNSDTFYEQFRAWQHLRLANMIESTITPISVAGGTGNRKRVGYNTPPSELKGAGWGLFSIPVDYAVAGDPIIEYHDNDIAPNHVLVLGGDYSDLINKPAQLPVLFPAEAKLLDDKIDDGRPTIGKVVVQKGWFGWCHSSDGITTWYPVDSEEISCTLIFKTGL